MIPSGRAGYLEPMSAIAGFTSPFAAAAADRRFSWSIHIPESASSVDGRGRPRALPLVVAVHGSGRGAASLRDRLAPFASARGCAVLVPLFPVGAVRSDDSDADDYKFIEGSGVRYDELLLSMIDEAAGAYPISTDRFFLHGFSGGGQFAHRFFYLHPDRLAALSVGAPGRATMLDDSRLWWTGTGGFEERFGSPIDMEALCAVPVQLVAGARDTEPLLWPELLAARAVDDDAPPTRLSQLQTMQENFAAHGLSVRTDIVPGIGHDGEAVLGAVAGFFADFIEPD